jgi:cytochrome c6
MKRGIPICLAGTVGLVLLTGKATPQSPTATHIEPQSVFMENCAACHQAGGVGIPGVFPALAADAFVRGDPSAVVRVILGGRNGMPSFRNDLSDEQIAAVASYIRQNFGNTSGPVAASLVAEVRARTNNPRTDNPPVSN